MFKIDEEASAGVADLDSPLRLPARYAFYLFARHHEVALSKIVGLFVSTICFRKECVERIPGRLTSLILVIKSLQLLVPELVPTNDDQG
jgi:hypothetical protein